ncbi:MAG: phosphotransferase family protein [Mycobacteriales bacterium]
MPTAPGADAAAVGPYLARVLAEPGWRDCTVEVIAGGRSNLTYLVTGAPGSLVLRRPPLRAVRPTAHDVAREHRVLSALAGTVVPVPRPVHLCTDPDVLGAPFYLMERVDGVIARQSMPPGYADTAAERVAITHALVDVLADLHAVDPAAVGLTGFGRPDGYLARQLRRWLGEWEALRAAAGPAVDALAGELADRLPTGLAAPSGPVVHGDYRLDNVVLDPADPGRVAAVLDWEMSTLGDPLADLGLLVVYWQQGRPPGAPVVTPSVTALPGFPSRSAVVERYAARTGRDVAALPWYVGFGYFKLAVVVAGIAARHRAGAMADNTDNGLSGLIEPLADWGRAELAAPHL